MTDFEKNPDELRRQRELKADGNNFVPSVYKDYGIVSEDGININNTTTNASFETLKSFTISVGWPTLVITDEVGYWTEAKKASNPVMPAWVSLQNKNNKKRR